MEKKVRNFIYYFLLFLAVFFTACSTPAVKPLEVNTLKAEKLSFIKDVKPVLEKRCVVCHSCYNSPCQAKYSSYEGLDRGASKILVYDATRLDAIDPTRLFIDANSTKQWRNKGFFSLIENTQRDKSYNDSLMLQLLSYKEKHPTIQGPYDPEHETWMCPKDSKELGEYFKKKPYHGMPYGFPNLSKKEYHILYDYLVLGALPPIKKEERKLKIPSKKAQKYIDKWEKFLNQNDAKHSVTARYLYEHIYLGHINFEKNSKEFFELVRSYTPSPKPIEVIPTLRVFDDPKVKKFYYRFRKIHSSIVHKTHIVLTLDDAQYKEIDNLFIQTNWNEPPHKLNFEPKRSANPFVNFYQIPAQSRYRFLLRNAHFIITTFIRGPVCRGQMAVNVIRDHFWVMFLDPKYDLSIKYNSFLLLQANNLEMPIESTSQKLLETFSDAYRAKYKKYFFTKEKFYDKEFPKGLGIDAIWAGESKEDAPVLTIYRHFNSASVHRGVLGALPKTAWVMDYPQFERLYYTLVVGYDVFGNVSHQTNIRRYMDFLRMEGEINFVSFLPPSQRYKTLRSWYIGDDTFNKKEKGILVRDTGIVYKTTDYKKEFIEQVIAKRIKPKTAIDFDTLNYNTLHIKMPQEFKSKEDVDRGFAALDKKHVAFIQYMNDFGTNNALMRIKLADGSYMVRTLVVNRWHDNVNSLFLEKYRLNPKKDTIDILKGSIGSYPNMFVSIDIKDLDDFFNIIENFDGSDAMIDEIKNYLISRSDPKFWEVYDWFQGWFAKVEPIKSGIYDLNRYYKYPF